MIWLLLAVLCWLHCNIPVRAAPAYLDPYARIGLSHSDIELLSNVSTSILELPSSNTSVPSNSGAKRVPNTSTFLVMGILNHPIPRFKLGRTILRTQAEVRDYIIRHDANDTSLTVADDPYESNPYWEGCYFGVAELPYGTKLMTYGIVYNVLEGLRLWLYMDRVDKAAVFEVRHEEFGAIGIGRISPYPHPPKSMGVGDRAAST